MPKLGDITKRFTKWSEISEMEEGAFGDIEPGLYTLVITACEASYKDEYFTIEWDVADGECKGNYSKSQYPPSTRVYWKGNALGFLKHKLHALADWNPGFKPTVAFETDQWEDFVGKRFGAVVRRKLWTAGPNSNKPGADRKGVEISAWLLKEDYEAGNVNESLLADNDMRDTSGGATVSTGFAAQPQQQSQAAVAVPDSYGGTEDVYDEDVPF